MKRFITSLLIALLIITCFPHTNAFSVDYVSLQNINEQIADAEYRMNAAHDMAEAARNLGYEEQHHVINLAQEEYGKAEEEYNKCLTIKEQMEKQWKEKEIEYPTATYIWIYLKNIGYNDYVAAGILGNIMTEVGGNTLNIQETASNNYYYGMCQWSKTYSEVWGSSLEYQCDYLLRTIEYELNTFGYAYKNGFNYEKFISITNEKEAAKVFAVCYERCDSKSHKLRQANAKIAYDYFTK